MNKIIMEIQILRTLSSMVIALILYSCRPVYKVYGPKTTKKTDTMIVQWYFNSYSFNHPEGYTAATQRFYLSTRKGEILWNFNQTKEWNKQKNGYSTNKVYGYNTNSKIEFQKLDSILKIGTVTKMKGDWYKHAFHPYSLAYYQAYGRINFKEISGIDLSTDDPNYKNKRDSIFLVGILRISKFYRNIYFS